MRHRGTCKTLEYLLTKPDNVLKTTESSITRSKYIEIRELDDKENYFSNRKFWPEGSKIINIYGPEGGTITWFVLSPEDRWLLASMLSEGLDDKF